MPLKFLHEQETHHQLIHDGLVGVMTNENDLSQSCDPISVSTVQFKSPHMIYDLPFAALFGSDDGNLLSARPSGIRYLVHCNARPFAAAELHPASNSDDGSSYALAHINCGPFVQATATAFDELAFHPLVLTDSYEARILRCAPLYVMAVWLKSEACHEDYLLPLLPQPGGHRAGNIHTARDFRKGLKAMLKIRSTASPNAVDT